MKKTMVLGNKTLLKVKEYIFSEYLFCEWEFKKIFINKSDSYLSLIIQLVIFYFII